ncbi:hypothetical protein [Sediminibacterium ginsengisoli]|uniref:KTSC domain-containing protein n=1 Tax=Sediminibacterium ginsengisoli TaxID=413434 RepID=A0A1T4M784_9BACT|nr:hypothetical protein [Sediminibacterium ginsengisoli]SJZ62771.1 hypothetical protein SAMN04488132_103218 [Sediminibacterium ginsengisoli]
MTQYKNLSGTSGILAYEIGTDSITVQFKSGQYYLYNTSSTSAFNIERMKQLAVAGSGLSTFISTTVKDGYHRKWR